MIRKALDIANRIHYEQMRKYSDQPYIMHILRVAGKVANYTDDKDMIAAALLHDTIEDHPNKITLDFIKTEFNERVAKLVDELTNASKEMKLPRAERKRLDVEKLCTVSKEAKFIKIIDRTDNVKSLINDITANPKNKDLASFGLKYCKESLYLFDQVYEHCEPNEELWYGLNDALILLEDTAKKVLNNDV